MHHPKVAIGIEADGGFACHVGRIGGVDNFCYSIVGDLKLTTQARTDIVGVGRIVRVENGPIPALATGRAGGFGIFPFATVEFVDFIQRTGIGRGKDTIVAGGGEIEFVGIFVVTHPEGNAHNVHCLRHIVGGNLRKAMEAISIDAPKGAIGIRRAAHEFLCRKGVFLHNVALGVEGIVVFSGKEIC